MKYYNSEQFGAYASGLQGHEQYSGVWTAPVLFDKTGEMYVPKMSDALPTLEDLGMATFRVVQTNDARSDLACLVALLRLSPEVSVYTNRIHGMACDFDYPSLYEEGEHAVPHACLTLGSLCTTDAKLAGTLLQTLIGHNSVLLADCIRGSVLLTV